MSNVDIYHFRQYKCAFGGRSLWTWPTLPPAHRVSNARLSADVLHHERIILYFDDIHQRGLVATISSSISTRQYCLALRADCRHFYGRLGIRLFVHRLGTMLSRQELLGSTRRRQMLRIWHICSGSVCRHLRKSHRYQHDSGFCRPHYPTAATPTKRNNFKAETASPGSSFHGINVSYV